MRFLYRSERLDLDEIESRLHAVRDYLAAAPSMMEYPPPVPLLDIADKLLAECRRLRAVVGRLPKTADGVRIVPNEVYWVRMKTGERKIVSQSISYTEDGWWISGGDRYGYFSEDLYSTPETARAAKERT